MKDLTIKVKLILIFIILKIVPLFAMLYIAYLGIMKLESYVDKSTVTLFTQSKKIISDTANLSIEDSIRNLDKKSQESLEKISYEIAQKVAGFLYERDRDLLFLSKLEINQKTLEKFYETSNANITIHGEYNYDETTNSYISGEKLDKVERENKKANLKDNEKEFNFYDPINYSQKSIPLYKEISYFDLEGNEVYKVSSINKQKTNVSNKINTYVKAEDYFNEIKNLKENEIYVSDVIGEYVGTKVIGTFTKEKAQKAGIEFEPEKYGYAGIENPLGKRFEGIIRFITPVYENGKKVGYISLALDHKHVREFTDSANPTGNDVKQNISDARLGNYAFMWDYEGKNISHPRDYSIVGYDKETGNRVMPWLSADLAQKYYDSKKDINEFLKDYPIFEEQSLSKKPNLKQVKEDGNVGLDCRYLNFAPQCEGWMQLTQNGGYGSFIINWSNVWKLTTAAAIPYYTGKYGNSKRGFGFVSIGASVDDFHQAANKTKEEVLIILDEQTKQMEFALKGNLSEIESFISLMINELTAVTMILVILIIFIAVWLSNYITSKINNLLIGTKKFANNELDYRIKVSSNDEIGKLESSFNEMAIGMNNLIVAQRELNEHLEEKVNEKTKELLLINQNLEEEVKKRTKFLNEALIKAQNSDKVKSIFLANMSHEIRTPLNSIIGFSELLADNKDFDEDSRRFASIIEDSAKSLLTIINDILDISKIESGNFEININRVDIKKTIQNVYDLFSKKAQEKYIDFNLDFDSNIPNQLLVDGIRLRQVISNFVNNAIKFTPNEGKVDLKVSLIEKEESRAKIKFLVKDNGIGIPKHKIKEIFEPFIQLDNESNRRYDGTGLGLSICEHIVKLMGSQIELDTQINEGSTFWFDLELDICEEKVIKESKINLPLEIKYENDKSKDKNRVLVVIENILSKNLIEYFFNNLSVDYKIIDNNEISDELNSKDYSFALVDLSFIDEVMKIRENSNSDSLPIVLLSPNSINNLELNEDVKNQIDFILENPVTNEKLLKILNKYLEIKSDKNDEFIKVNYKKEDAILQLGLDELTVDMLLDNFFLTLDIDLLNLEKAIESKDKEKVVQTAHYLKGSCLNLAMNDVAKILQEVEQNAKEGIINIDIATIRRAFFDIKSTLNI